MSTNSGTPTLSPPAADTGLDVELPGTTEPVAVSDAQIAALVTESTPVSGPTLRPPQADATDAATATWRNNVKIDAIWVIDETRNAWARVVGVGWRRLYNGRDGAFQALATLASQARQTNRTVNLREESDGMIYEIYLW